MAGTEASLDMRAGEAIGRCLALEASEERGRIALGEDRLDLSREVLLDLQAGVEGVLRMCQALDAFSRAQWLPLLRRGLAGGRIGDAHGLLTDVLGSPYQQVVELEIYPSLRKDAFRCHEPSLSMLYYGQWPPEKALTVDERLAVWQVLKQLYEAKPDETSRELAHSLSAPDQANDPAEVQRIEAAIRPHCQANQQVVRKLPR